MAKYEIITNKLNTFFTNNKISVANTVPGSGDWRAGDIVYSSTPTSMCYGWMCIESGTPGNWITLNNTDIIPVHDTRGENPKPKEFLVGRRTEFKSRKSINNPSGGHTYTIIDTVKGWTDNSGGSTVQMSYGADKAGTKPMLSVRSGDNSAESWGSWYDLYHSGNKPTWDDIDGKPSSFPVASHNHDTMYFRTQMGNVTDFNKCISAGIYYARGGELLNAPQGIGSYGVLEVVNLDDVELIQRYQDYNGNMFTRFRNNHNGSTWLPWNKIYSQNNIPEKAGSSDMTIQPMRSNEINFGGSFKDNTSVFFGYRSIEGRPVPNIYVFGSDGGTATIQAGDVTVKGHSVYSIFNKPPANSVTLQDSSNLFTATDVEGAMKELFTNVDNGKSSIAQAIIAKGVSGASKDNTFQELSTKIRQIKQFKVPSWIPETGVWISRMTASMPEFSRYCGSVVVDGKLYVVGGQSTQTKPKGANNNLCYDFINNRWDVKANLLRPITCGTIGYVDGKIYYISGTVDNYTDRHESIYNNQCYDIATNSWSEKAQARTRRSGSCGASIDKSIYIMYGHKYYDYTASEDIDVYNTVTNTWSSGGTVRGHAPRFDVASVTKEHQIFFMGGRDSDNNFFNTFEMYDTQTKTWTTLPNIPVKNYASLASIKGDDIYLVIGYEKPSITGGPPLYVYNMKTKAWTTKKQTNLDLNNGAGGIIGDSLIMVGGDKGNTNTITKEGEFMIL